MFRVCLARLRRRISPRRSSPTAQKLRWRRSPFRSSWIKVDSQTVVGIVVGMLFLAGLIGALISWIPEPLFILIGALVWAIATQFAVIGVGRLVILVTLALTTLLVNFAAGPIAARRSGGSR